MRRKLAYETLQTFSLRICCERQIKPSAAIRRKHRRPYLTREFETCARITKRYGKLDTHPGDLLPTGRDSGSKTPVPNPGRVSRSPEKQQMIEAAENDVSEC